MRISDWSSDVCSSDRSAVHLDRPLRQGKCEGDLLVELSARHQLQHLALPRRKRLDLGARPRAPSSDRLPGLVDLDLRAEKILEGPSGAEDGRHQHGIAEWRSVRSEEHTSELQSLMRISYAVFCLKKKTQT